MRLLPIALCLFLAAGCGPFGSAAGKIKQTATKSSEASSMQAVRAVGAPAGAAGVVTIKVAPVGVTATVPAGASVDIKSEAENKNGESSFLQTIKSASLPWGVYVAVILLIVGGIFIAFRVGFAWGAPLILGGVAVFAIFSAITAYPAAIAWGMGACAAIAVGWYAWHAHTTAATVEVSQAQADALTVLKKAINDLDERTKDGVKAGIKRILGASTNPARKAFDEQIANS